MAPLFSRAFGAMRAIALDPAKCTRIVDTETELNPPLESLSRGFNTRTRADRDDKVDKLMTQITTSSC